MLRSEEGKDRQYGRRLGFRRPWNTFDLHRNVLKKAEDKAQSVSAGTERFTKEEEQAVVAYLVRRSG